MTIEQVQMKGKTWFTRVEHEGAEFRLYAKSKNPQVAIRPGQFQVALKGGKIFVPSGEPVDFPDQTVALRWIEAQAVAL